MIRPICKQSKTMFKIYIVSYVLPNGSVAYWRESLSFKAANKLGKRLAASGYRPKLVKFLIPYCELNRFRAPEPQNSLGSQQPSGELV